MGHRLAAECSDWFERVEKLNAAVGDTTRTAQVGLALGDWLLVNEHSDRTDLIADSLRRCADRVKVDSCGYLANPIGDGWH